MKSDSIKLGRIILSLVLGSISVPSLSADVVETKDGARIPGKILKIEGGLVVVETSFAGTISIKQADVIALNTEAAIAIRLASGTRLAGLVTTADGSLKITNADGVVATTMDKIAALWSAGAPDPQITALERKWAYEASFDLTGKSGNTSQLGTSTAVRATLAGAKDTLVFYSAYDRQKSEGLKSADQFKAGGDYQNNFSGQKSWYIRDEGGFDRIKDIEFYNVAAAGLGFDLIKKSNQTVTGRVGLSFRSENYLSPLTVDVNAAGLDFGFSHALKLTNLSLVNRLTIVPSFSDFADFRAGFENFLELPLANPNWKIRLGISNDYNSKPGRGVTKMDTSYFSRLVLNWK
jgi:Protein of unknown function, DUF481